MEIGTLPMKKDIDAVDVNMIDKIWRILFTNVFYLYMNAVGLKRFVSINLKVDKTQ